MNQPNPYETPRLESDTGSIKLVRDCGKNACPLCGEVFSRWEIMNTISTKVCKGCGKKLWLVLPPWCLCVLCLLGLASISPFYWITPFPAPGSQFFLFQIIILPFSMLFISFALRFRFGTIVASEHSTQKLR